MARQYNATRQLRAIATSRSACASAPSRSIPSYAPRVGAARDLPGEQAHGEHRPRGHRLGQRPSARWRCSRISPKRTRPRDAFSATPAATTRRWSSMRPRCGSIQTATRSTRRRHAATSDCAETATRSDALEKGSGRDRDGLLGARHGDSVLRSRSATSTVRSRRRRVALERVEKFIVAEPDHGLAIGWGVTALVALRREASGPRNGRRARCCSSRTIRT